MEIIDTTYSDAVERLRRLAEADWELKTGDRRRVLVAAPTFSGALAMRDAVRIRPSNWSFVVSAARDGSPLGLRLALDAVWVDNVEVRWLAEVAVKNAERRTAGIVIRTNSSKEKTNEKIHR